MIGWYFSGVDRKLRYGDGRLIVVGETHTVECVPALCEQGLHASQTVLQALQYAPGPIIWRVELSGKIVCGDDKACATERRYIAGGIDATPMLSEFARKCALSVIHLWDAPRIVRDYLESGDESLRAAASDAALDAAWDAASAAAWAAAMDAAWAAAWAAASAAAWAAAMDAASVAASDAARDAAMDAQSKMLEDMAIAAIAKVPA